MQVSNQLSQNSQIHVLDLRPSQRPDEPWQRITCLTIDSQDSMNKKYYYAADVTPTNSTAKTLKEFKQAVDFFTNTISINFFQHGQLHEHYPRFMNRWNEQLSQRFIKQGKSLVVYQKKGFYRQVFACHTPIFVVALAKASNNFNIVSNNQGPVNLTANSALTIPSCDMDFYPFNTKTSGIILNTQNADQKMKALNILNSTAAALLNLSFQNANVLKKYAELGAEINDDQTLNELSQNPTGGIDSHILDKLKHPLNFEARKTILQVALGTSSLKQSYSNAVYKIDQNVKNLRNDTKELTDEEYQKINDWLYLADIDQNEYQQLFDKLNELANKKFGVNIIFDRQKEIIRTVKEKVDNLIAAYKSIAVDVLNRKMIDGKFPEDVQNSLGKLTGLDAYNLAHPQTHQMFNTSFVNPLAAHFSRMGA